LQYYWKATLSVIVNVRQSQSIYRTITDFFFFLFFLLYSKVSVDPAHPVEIEPIELALGGGLPNHTEHETVKNKLLFVTIRTLVGSVTPAATVFGPTRGWFENSCRTTLKR
jgi:hypothetical protein